MTELPAGKFLTIWPNRQGYFVRGVLVADWRPSGRVYKVTLYCELSSVPFKVVLVSTQDAARRVCVELAQQAGQPDGAGSE